MKLRKVCVYSGVGDVIVQLLTGTSTHMHSHTHKKLSHFYHSVAKAILISALSAANDVSKPLSHSAKVENG